MRDAFAAVELIHSFLDCREKFNPLGNFTKRNLVGQLANGIQYNFFLRHVVNMPRPSSQSKLEGSAKRIAIGFGRQLLQSEQPTELRSLRSLLSELRPSSELRMSFSGDKGNARRVGWRENASGCAKPADNFRPWREPK